MTIPTEINSAIVQRIEQAANELYEETQHTSAPTVDQVRRRARANMHDVTAVMRHWRQTLLQRQVQRVEVPESLSAVLHDCASTIWQIARTAALAEHAAALTEWQALQSQDAVLRQELEEACEAASEEAAQERTRNEALSAQILDLRQQLDSSNAALKLVQQEQARITLAEHERQDHLNDLRGELEHARSQLRESVECAKALQADKELLLAAQVKQVQAHAAEVILLRTEIDTMRAQHDALLNSLERRRAVDLSAEGQALSVGTVKSVKRTGLRQEK